MRQSLALVVLASAVGLLLHAVGSPQATTAASAQPATFPEAQALYEGGRWSDAEATLHRLLAADPASAPGQYLLAHTLFHEDKPKESLRCFTLAATLRPPSALDLRLVALDYVLLNDYDDADHWILRSLQDDPHDGESWYTLGRIRYTENRFADAIASFGKALTLLPKSIKAENNLGLAYEGLNQADQAERSYRQALAWQVGEAQPSAEPGLNLGILLTDRNQLDEALPLLERAEALDPKSTRVHSALGKLYLRRNDLPAAERELTAAVAESPQTSALHFQLGQVLRKEGKTAHATEELQQAETLERAGRR